MSTTKHRIPVYRHRLRREAEEFLGRHFTDPQLSLEDAAVVLDVNERTLREALASTGAGWKEMLRTQRVERGAELLAETNYLIAHVARLAGYNSASAFAKAFEREMRFPPAAYRRAFKGPSRAGGATGAWARRKSSVRPGVKGGKEAVHSQLMHEATERLVDRSMMEHFHPWAYESGLELEKETSQPRHPREERQRWQGWRDRFTKWAEENDPGPTTEPRRGSPEWIDLFRRIP